MFHRLTSSAARLLLPAMLITPALFASHAARAAGLPPGLDPGTKAALLKMPAYNPPAAYSEDIVITTDDKKMTMKRYVDGSKIRTDMNAQDQDISTIELGDDAGTVYHLVPKEKQAIKMTSGGMTKEMTKAVEMRDTTETENPPPPGYKVEYLGEKSVDGRATKKFRMTTDEGSALGWFDAANGAPVRMEGTNNGKKAVMEWKNFKAAPQPAKLFEVPKGYKVVDVDAMREQMKGMTGMGGMMKNMAGRMAGGMAGSMAGGMMGGMGQNLGEQLGGAVGGPLGAMAGGYLGGRIGNALGREAAGKVTGQ